MMESSGSLWILNKFVFCMVLAIATHLLGIALVGALAGARIQRIGFFFGKPLFTTIAKGVEIKIGSIPTGGYVAFEGMEFDGTHGNNHYKNLPLFNRLLISIGGVLSLVVIGCLLLSFDRGWSNFISGFSQFVIGGIAPLAVGQKLLARLIAVVREDSFWVVLGLMMMKMAAFNLLPIPVLNGGAFLVELLRTRLSEEQTQKVLLMGFAALVLLFSGWMVALAAFAWNAVAH